MSRVCQLCRNAIRRLIKSASITPRWEKGGTRPKCCISNCHATSFATSEIATSEQISQIFPCSNIPCPTPLCKRHYHIVYDTIQSKQTHCFTCNSSLCNFCVRVCPNPKLVQQVLCERTGFEETIPTSVRVCASCYKAYLLIIKEGPKSIDQDLIQLITDLKRGISSSDTIKIKYDIVNKALHTLVNPRRACAARVTVLGLSFCLSVCLSVRHAILAIRATKSITKDTIVSSVRFAAILK